MMVLLQSMHDNRKFDKIPCAKRNDEWNDMHRTAKPQILPGLWPTCLFLIIKSSPIHSIRHFTRTSLGLFLFFMFFAHWYYNRENYLGILIWANIILITQYHPILPNITQYHRWHAKMTRRHAKQTARDAKSCQMFILPEVSK